MSIDKENPKTWTRFEAQKCNSCVGSCCMMPVEVTAQDLIRLELLTQDELETEELRLLAKRLIKQGIVKHFRQATGLFLLERQSDESCVFLDKNRRCRVYEKRPMVCRDFPERRGNRLGFCPYKEKAP